MSDSRPLPVGEASPPVVPTAPWWSLLLVGLVVAFGVFQRSIDLDPPALWLDDLWVAVLARVPLDEGLRNGSSTPPGVLLPILLSIRAIEDPELGAQLVPFLCSIAALPLVAAAAWRYTGRWECMVVATVLVACDPVACSLATHVKQYPSDLVVAAVHLLLLHRVVTSPTPRALWAWVGAAAVGFLVSTTSLFLAATFLPAAAVAVRRRLSLAQLAWPCATAAACALAVHALVVHGAVTDALRSYWAGNYVDGPTFALTVVGRWLAQPWHGIEEGRPQPLVALAAGGLVLLAARGGTPARALVGALGGLSLLVLGVSAAGWFPVGIGRVEQFLLPPLVVAMTCGMAILRPAAGPRQTLWAASLLGAGVAVACLSLPRFSSYPGEDTGPLVVELNARKREGDALLVDLRATYALSYYGPWPVRLVARPSLPQGFYPMPETTNVRVLFGATAEEEDVAWATQSAPAPGRLFVLLCLPNERAVSALEAQLARAGWRRSDVLLERGSRLLEFSR